MKTVRVKDLIQYFGYHHICGDETSFERIIHDNNVNRPGLELSGYYTSKAYRRIVILGEKEINYIRTMSADRQREAFDFITTEAVPMILISRNLPCPAILLQMCMEKNFPVFSSCSTTSAVIVEIVTYLEEFFAEVESIHGVLMSVFGHGVLITGESGIGKSEVALELIKKGHLLVADDRVDVFRLHNHITGTSPGILKNMLEIRGVGIIEVTSMFGIASTTERAQIDYVIHLKKWNPNEEYDRVGMEEEHMTIFGVNIPKITIPVSEGRSISTIIEAAVTNCILRDKGINSSRILEDRVVALCQAQKED